MTDTHTEMVERDDFLAWNDCWRCGGEGTLANCWEEFACIDPESGCEDCLTRCDICEGKGGWSVDDKGHALTTTDSRGVG